MATRTRLTRRGQVVFGILAAMLAIAVVWGLGSVFSSDDDAQEEVSEGAVEVGGLAARFPPAVVETIPNAEATFYGPGLEGGITASGEPFDASRLTAAHATIEFGTPVRVTRSDDGRSVEVVVNDRPATDSGSLIDLTAGAFQRIASTDEGRIPVTIEVLAYVTERS